MTFPTIVEFARFLWGAAISPAQIVVLKCLHGLPLDSGGERSIWKKFAGRSYFARYQPREYSEAVLLLGRQSGKSSRLGVTETLWTALCIEHAIPPGERLAVLLFAPTLRQNTFTMAVDKLHTVPELAAMIETDASADGEVRLTNGVDLLGISSNPRHARGRTAILAVVDEAAFIHTSLDFDCNLPELLESIRPSLIVRRGKLLLLSSPAGKEGPLFQAWENREANSDCFVWRAPSAAMNPSIDPALLERERKRGEAYFAREYLAEFTDAANPFLPEEAIARAVQKGITQLDPSAADAGTFAGIDLADKRDDCALTITAARNVDGRPKAVVLFGPIWKPGPNGHNVLKVLEEMGALCQAYGVMHAKGDQKSMSVAENVLGRFGVRFERAITDGQGSEQMYRTFLGLLNNGDVALLDHEELLTQLRRLEEKTSDGNRFRVAGRRGTKDDLAVSCVLSVSMAANSLTNAREPWVEIIGPDAADEGVLALHDGPSRLWHSI